MAFIQNGGVVLSYCDASDIRSADQRTFDANELVLDGLPLDPENVDQYLEDLAVKATARINQRIRASQQWRRYLGFVGEAINPNNVPEFEAGKILARQQDFSEMCAYYTLKEYLLPKVADFGNPESAEVQKIKYFESKFNDLFTELLGMMDWYDFDGSGAIDEGERFLRNSKPRRRSRGGRSIVRVR